MSYIFRGGIYFGDYGKIKGLRIERPEAFDILRVPLNETDGKRDNVLVSPGDTVFKGSVIGIPTSVHSVITHSPVSGKVLSVGETDLSDGHKVPFVEIQNDGKYNLAPNIKKCEKKLSECESGEIMEIIHRAGIVDTISGVSASEKIITAEGRAELCIVNCVFDDPSVSSDYRLAKENPASVINGLKIILKALGLRRGIIAVGENYGDLIKKMKELLKSDRLVSVCSVRGKYPAGGMRELTYAVTGTELSFGKTSLDAGCVIFGAATAANIFSTFVSGVPNISRIVTVSGNALKRGANVIVPIGTPAKKIIEYVGGICTDGEIEIITDGVMRGKAASDLEFSVTKTMTSIIVNKTKANAENNCGACIRCGRCISVCPMRIVPTMLYKLIEKDKIEIAIQKGALLCDECGACTYICLGKLPLAAKIADLKTKSKKTNDEKETEQK